MEPLSALAAACTVADFVFRPRAAEQPANISQQARQVPRLTEAGKFCSEMVARPYSRFAEKPLVIGPPPATDLF